MSRLRKAVITASFGYLQYGLALVSGIVMVPFVLSEVGPRTYGLWLASGELIGYAGMVDLGVLGVLPWMFAEAQGRGDRQAMRTLLVSGLVVGVVIGLAYALLAGLLWVLVPWAFGLDAVDRGVLSRPLVVMVVATMVASPFRVLGGLLEGIQDVTFNGRLALTQSALGVIVALVMLSRGHGLLALGAASAVPALFVSGAVLVRALIVAPDLLTTWSRPSWTIVRTMVVSGVGVWLSGWGWRLVAASNGLVIAGLGRPEWVAVYACTAKLSAMATQITWILPDAGLIPLAQVSAEHPGSERVRGVVAMMLRLHMLLAGGACCALLALNPLFVSRWVGHDLFGGVWLNALLAFGIVSSSVVHGLFAAAAVLGARLRVGLVSLASGVVQVGIAWAFGRVWGLPGVAAAGVAAAALVAIPFGAVLLESTAAMRPVALWRDLVRPWTARVTPLAGLAACLGAYHETLGIAGLLPLVVCLGVAYLWHMRPLYALLALDPRVGRWLTSLRLLRAEPRLSESPRTGDTEACAGTS